ncbi:uncharacterized protein EKO05_0004822 [Ascochyta rabiei]|uniref:uncharacterized protein n=1 Tax=Didymella rabiei TaxID=5454 RepID=UPI002207D83F|nr:uncharacterized protein EKO05_0004822 [Ascochyta rabiei]UPX14335.1 hypothetical protein EKO05_0004822 [Ascochyta rabiei]
MLSSPDRQRNFEQLRAHWEIVVTGEDTNMVGRRKKPALRQAANDAVEHNAGGKFRRKLSHGLAFISLTQRKGVLGRQLSNNASLAVTVPSTNDSSTTILDHDALLSSQADPTSLVTFDEPPVPSQDDTNAGARQLPRSRTFSYIPRPVKTDAEADSVAELEKLATPLRDTVMSDPSTCAPSRIPTPSPPQSSRRGSSPRQCLPSNSPLQAIGVAKRQSLTNVHISPSKAAIRSRTTPNLSKTASTSQTASYMAPRKPGIKRTFASSTLLKPVLAENIPTSKRVAQRRSQIQDQAATRESLSVPSVTSNRRLFGPGVPLESKRVSFTAPSSNVKQLSSHPMQAPVTVRHTNGKNESIRPDSPRPSEATHVARPRPKSPLTAALSSDVPEEPLLAPPQLGPDDGTQRRTLGTSNRLVGVWGSSKVFATANHQVRRLPRSSTFHHFGKRLEPPPLPPIPNQYKSPSSSNLIQSVSHQYTSLSSLNLHHHFPMSSGQFGTSSRSLLLDIASAQKSSELESLKSESTSVSMTTAEVTENVKDMNRVNEGQEPTRDQDTHATSRHKAGDDLCGSKVFSTASNASANLLPVIAEICFGSTGPTAWGTCSERLTGNLPVQRRWSISERFCPNSANYITRLQVTDYMPPLYWAGRFQSRYDQWRTEAMTVLLNSEQKPEDDGPLGNCHLDDDKKAIVLIFMQLRDLCASAQAADSLHEFEYQYRKDHKMLDTKHDLPPSLRKPEELSPRGAIGRAVRKLTPRKASFANLFKGKGWNRNDDAKPADMPEHIRELHKMADRSDGSDATAYLNVVEPRL